MKELIRHEYDPMEIEGCVYWLPHDKFRFVLPTGQQLLRWNLDPSKWEYTTHGGKLCLHHTAESSGTYSYGTPNPFYPQTAGILCGNGCTISIWVYGNKSTGSNVMQFFCSSYQCPGDDPNFNRMYGGNPDEILLSPFTGAYGALREFTTGGTTVDIISQKSLSQLTTGWNCIQWTITAAGAATLYTNGTQRGTGTAHRECWIGCGSNALPNRAAAGYFRQYRLYNRVLTSSELAKLRTE